MKLKLLVQIEQLSIKGQHHTVITKNIILVLNYTENMSAVAAMAWVLSRAYYASGYVLTMAILFYVCKNPMSTI